MIVIQDLNSGYYFHSKGKIIVFENPQDAQNILYAFEQYAIPRVIQERQNPAAIFEVQQTLSSFAVIDESFEEEPECGFISFSELKK